MTVPATKWNYQITKATEIATVIKKAFQVAKHGRPGPVLIDITKNAQIEQFDDSHRYPSNAWSANVSPILESALIKEAAYLINRAQRPIIFAGHGITIAQAEKSLLRLAEQANVPVATTLLGLSSFPSQHPLFKGMLGMHGNYAANVLSNQADVVLAVGMRFDDRVTGDLMKYLRQAKVIHIDIDEAEINKNVKANVALNIDAKIGLTALTPFLCHKKRESWHKKFLAYYQKEKTAVIEKSIHPQTGKISMAEFVHLLSQKTQGQARLPV